MSINWISTDPIDLSNRQRLNQIIGANNFQNPWFLEKGWIRSRAVGVIPNKATAFLIRKDLIITNWHVFRRVDWAANKTVIFGYENGENGRALPGVEYQLAPDTFFYSCEELDFAVVHIVGDPGLVYGMVDISKPGVVSEGISINIIQHPGAELKKIAIRDNELKYHDDKILQYWTDTEHGSSGSPVYDDRWEIIGLHYQESAGVDIHGAQLFYNEAHSIAAIWENLKEAHPLQFF